MSSASIAPNIRRGDLPERAPLDERRLRRRLLLLLAVQAGQSATQRIHLSAHLFDEDSFLQGRVDAVQQVVEAEHRHQQAAAGDEPQPQEQALHADQAEGLNW